MTPRKARSAGKLPDPDNAPTASASGTPGVVAAQPPQPFGSLSHWLIPSTIKLFDAPPDQLDLLYTNAPPHPRVEASPALLDSFLRLESATNEAILAYAQRWGPLWLCDAHDLPFRHDPECRTFRDFEPVSEEELERVSQPEEQGKFHFATAWFQESLDGWRALTTQMRATLRIARRVHDGLAADDRDWDTLPFLRDVLVALVTPGQEDPLASTEDYTNVDELEKRSGLKYEDLARIVRSELEVDQPPGPQSPHADQHEVFWETYYRLAEAIGRRRMQASVELQREVVAGVLNQWLNTAGVRPRLEWGTGNPQVPARGRRFDRRTSGPVVLCLLANWRPGALRVVRHPIPAHRAAAAQGSERLLLGVRAQGSTPRRCRSLPSNAKVPRDQRQVARAAHCSRKRLASARKT